MSIICDDIPNTENVKKALYPGVPSMVRVRYVGESKIPGIDATKLTPCVLPVFYKKYADEIEAMKVYEDDVWVTSYPKCGTTWTQEMVWLIVNDLDYEGAKKSRINDRYGFPEMSSLIDDKLLGGLNTAKICQAMPRPRFIKSHHPIALLPTEIWTVKPKMVYVARNPKDTAISFYHHYVNLHRYDGSIKDFLDSFLNDLTAYAPYTDHLLDFWKLRNEPNILFITYEDMSKDLKNVLDKVANFFDKTYNDDQLMQLAKHLSFYEMKKNESVNREEMLNDIETKQGAKRPDADYRFIRRGEVNSAKDEMPAEYHKKFDDWLANSFKGVLLNVMFKSRVKKH